MGAIVILQRGRRVEAAEAPKHRSFPRCYEQAFATCVRVDAKWDSNSLRQEQSGRGSDRSGELPVQIRI